MLLMSSNNASSSAKAVEKPADRSNDDAIATPAALNLNQEFSAFMALLLPDARHKTGRRF
jgi:hypothetical protein